MLAVLALIVLGPERLPGAARTLGRLMGQLRSVSTSLQGEVREALQDPHDAFAGALADFRPSDLRPGEVRRNVRRAVIDTFTTPATTNGDGAPPGPARSAPASSGDRPVPDDPGFN